MTRETIRVIEELRKISDSEWEEVKKALLHEDASIAVSNGINTSSQFVAKLHDTIKEMGIPANVKGYRYIQEAVLLSIDNPRMLDRITKYLYPAIAKEFDTTPQRVERAMRHAIGVVFEKGNMDKINEVFGKIALRKGKIENSKFIAGLVEYVLSK